jgi:formylglycine-generating enzyme required for sulfatase activity
MGILSLLILSGCSNATDTALSSEKAITAFSFNADDNTALSSDITGTISGTEITATVPYGTDVTGLIVTFTTSGTSVTVDSVAQTSGTTENDFTSAVTYTVTAEDGSTQDYTVTVTVTVPCVTEGSGFSTASSIGESGVLTFEDSSVTLTMNYANNLDSILFPTGQRDTDGESTLTTKFWMGETEVTNAVVAQVFQWAYDEGKFSTTSTDSNYLDADTAMYGNQELLDLNDDYDACHVNYASESFTVDSGYEDHPVVCISWYGAVEFCNWLTEMRDGSTDNVVYVWTDDDADSIWDDDETTEDTTQTGYRLPSSDEWEYAARYRGEDDTNTVSGYSNPYYTTGASASGAITYYGDSSDEDGDGVVAGEAACLTVAVYFESDPTPTQAAEVQSLAANALGLYDMSGNVYEWCFTEYDSFRITRGGGWYADGLEILVGVEGGDYPDNEYADLGFRLCRTAD